MVGALVSVLVAVLELVLVCHRARQPNQTLSTSLVNQFKVRRNNGVKWLAIYWL